MRDRRKPNGFAQVAQISTLITKIAKDQLAARLDSMSTAQREAAAANIAQLNKLKSNLAQKPGLSQKNRQRLTPLRDEAVLARLLLLPIALARSLERKSDLTRDDALLAQQVLLLFILIYCPLRISSLLSVRLDRHVRWSRSDMKGELTLEFVEGELKNGEPASLPLPSDCARFLRNYSKRYLPLLHSDTQHLFAGAFADRPKSRVVMAAQIRDLIFKRTGLTMNAHLFRHVVHLIVLRKFPGAYAMVARILTHKNIETSLRNYAYFDVELSMRAYQEMVHEASGGRGTRSNRALGRFAYDDRLEG